MRLLLDTHAFIWWLAGSERLPARGRRAIGDDANRKLISAASAWEITTKHRLGKLPGAGELAHDITGAIAGEGFDLSSTLPCTYWAFWGAPGRAKARVYAGFGLFSSGYRRQNNRYMGRLLG